MTSRGLVVFFQAEDGIRDTSVTGVQTCALPISGSPGYNVTMTVPATSRQTRTFEDRADALAHFFLRAGEAPRLLAYDDAVGCPLDQAIAALEWTVAVGILAADDLMHAARVGAESAAAVVERKDG